MIPMEFMESAHVKKDIPKFNVGDMLRVYVQVKEEGKVRIQAFEGTVICICGRGLKATFTVRKISYGEGVERTFLLHSPLISKIEVVRKGKAKRAKLYYLREKVGKKSKVAQQKT